MATPEQLRQCAAAMLAAAEGKTVEFKHLENSDDFFAAMNIHDMWYPGHSYRVKPEPKLRPWKQEEIPVGACIAWCSSKKELITGAYSASGKAFIISGSACDSTELALKVARWCWPHEQCDGKWRECGVRE